VKFEQLPIGHAFQIDFCNKNRVFIKIEPINSERGYTIVAIETDGRTFSLQYMEKVNVTDFGPMKFSGIKETQ